MRLKVGDRLYLRLDKNGFNQGRDLYKLSNREYTKEELRDIPFTVNAVRKKPFPHTGWGDDVCIEWLDGGEWWWGQIGSSEPWTTLFISEKEYLRNKRLEDLGI